MPNRITVIALTGSIATGKSTVSAMIRDAGITVIDLDTLARDAVKPPSDAIQQIEKQFGSIYINDDNTLKRAKMRDLIFSDTTARKNLESIIHPIVISMMEKAVANCSNKGCKTVVVDIPLLYETGRQGDYDVVWVVYTTPDIQMERLCKRDGLNYEEAASRISTQIDIESKRDMADVVIDNSGNIKNTKEQIKILLENLNGD